MINQTASMTLFTAKAGILDHRQAYARGGRPMRSFVVGGIVFAVVGTFSFGAEPPKGRYYTIPIAKLEIIEGSLPPGSQAAALLAERRGALWNAGRLAFGFMQFRLDQPGEIEIVTENANIGSDWARVYVALQTRASGQLTGQCSYGIHGKPESSGTFRFRVPNDANTIRAADWFEYARASRVLAECAVPVRGNWPGAAWFRHRLQQVSTPESKQLAMLWKSNGSKPVPRASSYEPNWENTPALDFTSLLRDPTQLQRNRGDDYSELLSGGRAISENLQLDRQLNIRNADARTVPIAEIRGVTVREYDWQPQIRALRPDLDPLAAFIPADQHAVYFPSAAAAVAAMEELDRTGLAVFNLATTRGTDDRLVDRYRRQLGILSVELGKLLPPTMVSGIAVTGSDLYYDTGTDVAVLFACEQPEMVAKLLTASWPILKASSRDALESRETIADSVCRTLKTPDRTLCAIVAELPGAVLLTNSPAQVRRIADVRSGKLRSMSELPEYVYFRDRYRRGETGETGFALLTDAAIRRWCGPKWRIAHHRRLLTGSLLAAAHATHLSEMQSISEPRTVDDPRLGPITVSTRGVFNPALGSRLFQTPIAEVDLERVTKSEAQGYEQWRDSYQQNWSQFFDPIAVRFTVKPDRFGLDMTVMPLIERTRYKELLALSTGAKLPPNAGEPHPEALAHFVLGFNRNSEEFQKSVREFEGFVTGQDPNASIRSWIGDWMAVYADEDPLWDEFIKNGKGELNFWSQRGYQIPMALAVHVLDSAKHAYFLKTIRPMLGNGDAHSYRGVDYTSSSPIPVLKLYSVSLPDMWIVTPNERVLKRAIDRHFDRKEGKAATSPRFSWIGDSMAFTAKPDAMRYFGEFWSGSGNWQLRSASWANIPILNEWHNLNPNVDPVEFHEKWWGERLMCPAGGKYVWNATDGTMESTVLGHPRRPKEMGPIISPLLKSLRDVQMGVTFQMDGLRARVEVKRE
jgi:hypothetical protein